MTVRRLSLNNLALALVGVCVLCPARLKAQPRLAPLVENRQPPVAVPRLIQYTGLLTDRAGRPLSGVQGVTFSFYQEQADAAPVWMETQNVTTDSQGRFTVLLGATQPQGLALEMFTSGQVHWLGVKASTEDEQARILLASVPYALVATRTETGPAAPLAGAAPGVGTITGLAGSNPNKPPFAQSSIEATDPVGPTVIIDATSGPPLQVNSTVKVPNLNVDMLNGFHDTDLAKIAGGNVLTGTQMVNTGVAGNKGVVIQGSGGQAANLQEWQALGGAVLSSVGSTGIFTGNGSGLTNLNASNVSSGVLAPAQGGTGLGSACPDGQVLKATGGSWTCGADNNSGGTVTSVATGNGLSGGPVTTTGTISLATCPDTQVLKSVGGVWTCGIPAVGTITGVAAGTGLQGGGAVGSVSLTIDPNVVPSLTGANAFTAPLQVTAGTGNAMQPAVAGRRRAETPRIGVRRTDVTPGPNLAAVSGTQTDASGETFGVFGKDNSPAGYGGAFQNLDPAGNSLTAFDSNDNPSLSVGGNGDVTIGGTTGSKLNLKTRATFTATGTVAGTAGSPTLTGTGTKFLSEIRPGDEIEIPGVGLPGFGIGVASVQSDTSLTASNFPSSFSGSTATVLPNILNISDPSGNLKFDIFGDGLFAIGNPGLPGQRVTVFGQESTANGFDGAFTLFNGAPGGGALWNLRTGATGTNTPAGGFSISSGLGTYRLVIDSTGRVGIATTTPGHKLDVNGDINASTNLCIAGVCKSSWPAVNPGTVTSVATGTGLTGGPITSSGTIAFDTTFGDGRYARLGAANTFTAGQTMSSGNLALGAGNLSIPTTTGPTVGGSRLAALLCSSISTEIFLWA